MKKNRVSFGFAMPAFIIYTVLLVLPIILAFYYSFFQWDGFHEMKFKGLQNYINIFSDARLGNAVINTLIIATIVIVAENVFGLLLALLVNKASKTSNFFRTIYFIPYILSGVAVTFIWKSIFSYNGVLNGILDTVGRSEMIVNWLGAKNTALFCIIIVEIWRNLGYHMMLYLAALQTVPYDLYEACVLDGGNLWDKFRHVTLPLIVPGISVSVLMSIINELKIYEIPKIMTDGGPGYDTETVVYNIVVQGFGNSMIGYSSAIAVLLFVSIAAISIFAVHVMSKKEVEM